MKTSDVKENELCTGLRCAIYKRFPSDIQRRASLEDQERNCRDAADQKGWTVVDEYVREDEALSGRALFHREGLQSLLREAERRPRPFDALLVEDTSVLGRDLTDVLKLAQLLEHLGIRLFLVSQSLDLFDVNFLIMLIVSA
jgi:site-specific DNA recombinase